MMPLSRQNEWFVKEFSDEFDEDAAEGQEETAGDK